MKLYTIYSSLLLYLLLCYGKKFADGGPFKTPTAGLSQFNYDYVPFSSGATRSGSRSNRARSSHKSQQERLYPIQLDINERKGTHKFNYFKKKGIHYFTAYPSFYFHRIKEGNALLWELSVYKYPQLVTAKLMRNGHYDIKVHFENIKSVLGGYPETREATRGLFPFQEFHKPSVPVHVISRNPKLLEDSENNLVVLDVTVKKRTMFFDYSYNVITNTHIYTACDRYLFKLVKEGMFIHWVPTNDEYANMVTVTDEPNGERSIKVFLADDAESDDEVTEEDLSRVFDVAFPLSSVYPEAFMSPFEDIADQQSITDVVGLDDEIAGKIPMTIDIMKKESNEQFEYFKGQDYGTYTPKHNFIFKLVKASPTLKLGSSFILWNGTRPEDYSNQIIIDLVGTMNSTNSASIYLTGGDSRHFSKSGSKWVEVEPLAIVDVSKERSGYEYEYVKNDRSQLGTFIPRGRFLFKGVKISKWKYTTRIVIDIWETTKPNEYATRIIMKGSSSSEQYIVIFHKDGTIKLFYKPESIDTWRDETANLRSIDTLKLFNVDLNAPKPTDKEFVEEDLVISDEFTPIDGSDER
ncbi:hypothetical protein MACK_002345 [Theileria orientalis]|uniref:Uncharacterized protein n=1 Tax=Theileria orientalis TaxID=68886 RepID=A0A976MBH5_THEOR|nr:hypothetical protein MACK_002345 [Theileria orientalis]